MHEDEDKDELGHLDEEKDSLLLLPSDFPPTVASKQLSTSALCRLEHYCRLAV